MHPAELQDGVDYSPYEGLELTGWPITIVLGGKVMVRDGKLVGNRGDGRYRSRSRSAFVDGRSPVPG